MMLEKLICTEVPIWVRFTNLPMEYCTAEGLSFVAIMMGRPLYTDAFTSSMARLDYARVCVVIDIHSKIRDHIVMMLPSELGEFNGTCKIGVEYEWRPPLCLLCQSFGHKDISCHTVKEKMPCVKPIQVYVPKPHKAPKADKEG